MIHRYEHNQTTWLEVISPTSDEVRELVAECGIPLEFAADLTTTTPKTEVHARKGFFKITLDFPVVKRTDVSRPHEIKFLVTKTHFVTIRFEDIEAVDRFTKEYEVLCMLGNSGKKQLRTDLLFLTMLDYLYVAMHAKLDYVESKLKDIEEQIFDGHEKEMVFELSQVSRRLITFRQTIGAHENALEKLDEAIYTAFNKLDKPKIEQLQHHYRSLNRHLHALTSVLDDLKDTNAALLNTKQNEIMKILTILAFTTFPLTLLASLFGMNATASMPLVGEPYDFWIIFSAMVVLSVLSFVYFWHKRWI